MFLKLALNNCWSPKSNWEMNIDMLLNVDWKILTALNLKFSIVDLISIDEDSAAMQCTRYTLHKHSLYAAKGWEDACELPNYSEANWRNTWWAYSGSILKQKIGPHGCNWSKLFAKNIIIREYLITSWQVMDRMSLQPTNKIPKSPLQFKKYFMKQLCDRFFDRILLSSVVQLIVPWST